MIKRTLGKTGIEVSEISLGTVSLGLPYSIEKKSKEDMISQSEAINLLRYALDKGVNFFDTSRIYGCSEERIGKAFKGKRDDVVICTKCYSLYDKNKQLLPENDLKKAIDDSLKKSLSDLQTDFVDVYMAHNADSTVLSSEKIAETFCEYKRKGLVRAIGVSSYTVEETRKTIERGIWDVIQLPYNLMDQGQEELFDLAYENGIGIVVRSALFKGILTDKQWNLHPKLKSIQEHREVYKDLLNRQVPTLSDLATKFVLSKKAVSSVLVGTSKIKNLDKALASANGKYLDEDTLAKISKLAYPEPEFLDLAKWYLLGWTS